MMKYMIALDGSASSEEAFNVVCRMLDKRRDELYLITAIQTFPKGFGPFENYNTQLEKIHRGYLEDFAARCERFGITYRCILAKGSHIGGLLCKAVDEKGIDFLVLGRRGMNKFSRLVAGSTSRYCMETANCHVIVVKGCQCLEDSPGSLSKIGNVKKLEEEERRRRMFEEAGDRGLIDNRHREAALIKEAAQGGHHLHGSGGQQPLGGKQWQGGQQQQQQYGSSGHPQQQTYGQVGSSGQQYGSGQQPLGGQQWQGGQQQQFGSGQQQQHGLVGDISKKHLEVNRLEEEERMRRIQEESYDREIRDKRAREAALITAAVREERESLRGSSGGY